MFFRSPIYVDALFDSVNGFATYVLDTPQYIGSGKFYIGWQQLQADELYVGFDANTDAHTHLYNHYGSGWSQSIIKGTVMMRPMFGGCIPAYTTAIESNNDDKLPIKIFPNPSNQIINISSGATSLKKVEISNVLGQPLIIQNINQQSESYYYDISSFIRGVYVIKLTLPNGTFKVSKFIKE
jgi:hypothetical protein